MPNELLISIDASLKSIASSLQILAKNAETPWTVEKVAEHLKVNIRTVQRWSSLGKLRPLPGPSRKLLFDPAEVRRIQ